MIQVRRIMYIIWLKFCSQLLFNIIFFVFEILYSTSFCVQLMCSKISMVFILFFFCFQIKYILHFSPTWLSSYYVVSWLNSSMRFNAWQNFDWSIFDYEKWRENFFIGRIHSDSISFFFLRFLHFLPKRLFINKNQNWIWKFHRK